MSKKKMKINMIKASNQAKQDQEVAEAIAWIKSNMLGIVDVWEYLGQKFDNPLQEVVSRFALIGISHVIERMED